MESSQSQSIQKAAELLQFLKERLASDLSEGKLKGIIDVEKEELQKIINLSIMSIDSNFSKSVETFFKL